MKTNKMKKMLSLCLLAVMVLTTVTGCSQASDDGEKTITFAVVGPLTGDQAEYGKTFETAVKMAVDEQNEKGGVLGYQIEVVVYDDKNTGEEAVNVAQKIVSDSSVVAVFGHFASTVAMAAAPIYEEAGIPLVNGSAGHVDFTGLGEYIFRNNDQIEVGQQNMLQILNAFDVKEFALLKPISDMGISTEAGLRDSLDVLIAETTITDMDMTLVEEYVDPTFDFNSSVAKIVDAGVDAVVLPGNYNVNAPFCKQLREVNDDILIFGTSSSYSYEFIELGEDGVEGVSVFTYFFSDSEEPEIQAFTAEYTERFGSTPSNFAAQMYDNAKAVIMSIENGNSVDSTSIKEQMYEVSFDGISGPIDFNENGDVNKIPVLLQVQDGAFVEVPNIDVYPFAEFVEMNK